MIYIVFVTRCQFCMGLLSLNKPGSRIITLPKLRNKYVKLAYGSMVATQSVRRRISGFRAQLVKVQIGSVVIKVSNRTVELFYRTGKFKFPISPS
jgi:hypothetical protein